MHDIKVGLHDTTLCFTTLDPMAQTEWINLKSSYHYGYIEFKDKENRKYVSRPIDYVGETLYGYGFMTFIIDSVDSEKRWIHLDFSTKEE
jgi:hypothetical protein